jgi:hypothetical protein
LRSAWFHPDPIDPSAGSIPISLEQKAAIVGAAEGSAGWIVGQQIVVATAVGAAAGGDAGRIPGLQKTATLVVGAAGGGAGRDGGPQAVLPVRETGGSAGQILT